MGDVRAYLKLGGWLVLQEFDSVSTRADPNTFESEHPIPTLVALQNLLVSRGADIRFGRKLFPLLESVGLTEVEAESHVMMIRGGSAAAGVQRANFEQMHTALVEGGLTEEQFLADLARLSDPAVSWPSQTLWTVRGRKST